MQRSFSHRPFGLTSFENDTCKNASIRAKR
nr:MAG TPA: hypothetical protein [Caudoviricetes sp.]